MSLKTMMTTLDCRNFNVTDFQGDNEFDKSALKDFLEPVLMHKHGREEYAPTIERPM